VTIGLLLGSLCAFFAYRQYHPALGHASCHAPFALRFQNEGLLPVVASNPNEDEAFNMYHSSNTGGFKGPRRESGNRLLDGSSDDMNTTTIR
jgi:diacylglycerol diphosphate phosphatase/phosphatidate phosphatase